MVGSMETVFEVDQHEDGQITGQGLTGVACRWHTALKQQGTDNSGGLWFAP